MRWPNISILALEGPLAAYGAEMVDARGPVARLPPGASLGLELSGLKVAQTRSASVNANGEVEARLKRRQLGAHGTSEAERVADQPSQIFRQLCSLVRPQKFCWRRSTRTQYPLDAIDIDGPFDVGRTRTR